MGAFSCFLCAAGNRVKFQNAALNKWLPTATTPALAVSFYAVDQYVLVRSQSKVLVLASYTGLVEGEVLVSGTPQSSVRYSSTTSKTVCVEGRVLLVQGHTLSICQLCKPDEVSENYHCLTTDFVPAAGASWTLELQAYSIQHELCAIESLSSMHTAVAESVVYVAGGGWGTQSYHLLKFNPSTAEWTKLAVPSTQRYSNKHVATTAMAAHGAGNCTTLYCCGLEDEIARVCLRIIARGSVEVSFHHETQAWHRTLVDC